MKELGKVKRILDIDIVKNLKERRLCLSQCDCDLTRLINKLNMHNSKNVSILFCKHFKLPIDDSPQTSNDIDEMKEFPYASTVGSHMYAIVYTRLDLTHPLSVVNRFLANPGKQHWNVVNWILRYLTCHIDLCLVCGGANTIEYKNNETVFIGYVDVDYYANIDKRRYLASFVFKLVGCTISWKSGLHWWTV